MALEILCPTCGQQVTVRKGGFVSAHDDNQGKACTFVRTAHSAGTTVKKRTPEELAAKKAAATVHIKATLPREKRKGAAATPRPKVECPNCGAKVQVTPKSGIIKAHQRPTSGRWCSGGLPPTEVQKKRARKKRSVWLSSGGLPTLGRR